MFITTRAEWSSEEGKPIMGARAQGEEVEFRRRIRRLAERTILQTYRFILWSHDGTLHPYGQGNTVRQG